MKDLIDRLNYKATKRWCKMFVNIFYLEDIFILNELYLFNEFEYSII